MLNQVMVATRGATDAFSGVGRNVNNSLRRFGAKNIEVGIGCGIGFGHGFGIGMYQKIWPLYKHRIEFVLLLTFRQNIGDKCQVLLLSPEWHRRFNHVSLNSRQKL
ncbi:unnamed protein product [Cuscuta campestris]|uniref:Uncharacterized protein n=1 Tax=Cuscuta campestris TaxID=132261 RepID=A0A484KGZ4_9ASTE|nr:unnamed protein product [Cuscuta campestris]